MGLGGAGGAGLEGPGGSAGGPLPEALKYLLLRCLVASLDRLSWRVWQVGLVTVCEAC